MTRVATSFVTVTVLGAMLGSLAACSKLVQRFAPQPAERKTQLVVAAQPRLPEDPAAGKRSLAQWRKHMQKEEDERQLGFDRHHSNQHRALIKRISAVRDRYDDADSERVLASLRADMPRRINELRRALTDIDHWGTNSRLLADYDALLSALAATYPDAKAAALSGHGDALEAARTAFDARLKKMDAWLERADENEEDEE